MDRRAIASIWAADRSRREMGDIAGLAESIRINGLLHPVVVREDGRLIAGARRLEACRLLEWTDVPVTIVAVDDPIVAERDENEQRKDFTPSEAVAIAHQVKESQADAANDRRRLAGEARHDEAALLQLKTGKTVDRSISAAEAVGMSETTLYRAEQVVKAGAEEPQRFGDLVEAIDTGRMTISAAEKELRRRKSTGEVRVKTFDGTRIVRHIAESLQALTVGLDMTDYKRLEPTEVRNHLTTIADSMRVLRSYARSIERALPNQATDDTTAEQTTDGERASGQASESSTLGEDRRDESLATGAA